MAAMIPQSANRIFIDGHSAVGKSRLARGLSEHLNIRWVKVDDFIVKREGRAGKYVQMVDRVRLHEVVDASHERLILDGLCLRHLFHDSDVSTAFWTYVKSEAYGDGLQAEIERNLQFGTDLYCKRYNPEATAHLVVTVPYQF